MVLDSCTASYGALREDYGLHNRSSFEETLVATNIERPVHHRFARPDENIAILSESVAEDPNMSTPRRSQELGLSYGTLWHTSTPTSI